MRSRKETIRIEAQGHYAASLDAQPDEVYDREFETLHGFP